MLDPDRRYLLVDALRPPAGMTLDHAVGTTFSLDLETLLLAPVAFALFDARIAEAGDASRSDPMAVMEAVRRHAGNIDLFCQTGQIKIPPREKPILALLEASVHPTAAESRPHIFHPKVWSLRYRNPDGSGIAYRLLVLSRNLTFDQSWDTIVRLDGELEDKASSASGPVADFIAGLPPLATRPIPDSRRVRIEAMADELRRVRWETPDGFTDVSFLPSGIAGYRHPAPEQADRRLVISPFLTNGRVQQLASNSRKILVVSRPDSLDLLAEETIERLDEALVLIETSELLEADDESIDPVRSRSDGNAPTGVTEETGERAGHIGPGLHAKVIVTEQGDRAEFRTGSTNATDAGWSGNVEFDVALVGKRSRCGIDTVLGDANSTTSLRTLLEPYRRSSAEPMPVPDGERVAVALERYGRELARMPLIATVSPDGEHYRIDVASESELPPSGDIGVRCWLVTRKPETSQTQHPGHLIELTETALSLQAITSFVAFELAAPSDDGEIAIRLVMNATLVGAPEDRAERLLLDQLKTKSDVLRYLLFLLTDIGEDRTADMAAVLLTGETSTGNGDRSVQVPLLESMVRALSRNPGALSPIDRLITDLSRTEEGRELLPDGLDQVWPVIWRARSLIS